MSEWQPIETAPKEQFTLEGRPWERLNPWFIGLWPESTTPDYDGVNGGPYYCPSFVAPTVWDNRMNAFRCVGAPDHGRTQPTHWMKLPEASKLTSQYNVIEAASEYRRSGKRG